MKQSFEKLVNIIEKLRSENGCPWDREQTIESLKKDLLDEAREVAEAIGNKDDENLREELGDLIWVIVLMAQIAKEEKRFDIKQVLEETNKKIIRRHPHVFAGLKFKTGEEVTAHWHKMKEEEKKAKKKQDDNKR